MDNKEKNDHQQLYGYLSQQQENHDPTNEQQSFEVHQIYPYEYDYNFSQQYHQYQGDEYEQYNMVPQSLSNYDITYSSIPQSSSSNIPDSLNHPSISTNHTASDIPFVISNQNHDQMNVFYPNSSKENEYNPLFSSEMFKKELMNNNTTPSIANTINFQSELNVKDSYENGDYSLEPNFSFYNEKHTSNPLSIINNHINQQQVSGSDSHIQKSNPRQEKDVFNELLSLATDKKQSPSLPVIQQQSQIPNEKAKNTQIEAQKKISSSTNHRNKYKNYSDTNSSCALDQFDLVYSLVMVQQPSRARMCGFGDKDRRPISPPPIAKLIITSKIGEPVSYEAFDISFLVAMCDIWKCEDNNNVDANIVKHHGSLSQLITFSDDNESTTVNMKNLVGSSAVSATKLYDLEGNLGIFFVFHDISLRTEGRFRLRIALIDIGSPYTHTVNTSSVSKVITSVYTDPFAVYTAKKFPGVTDSTPISKCFARQGIKISIRKDSSKNDAKSKENEKNNQNAD